MKAGRGDLFAVRGMAGTGGGERRRTHAGRARESLSPRERRWSTIAELGRLALARHSAQELFAWIAVDVRECLGAVRCEVFELSADHRTILILESSGPGARPKGARTEIREGAPELRAAEGRGQACVAISASTGDDVQPSTGEPNESQPLVSAACVTGTAGREVGIRLDTPRELAIASDMPIFLEVVTKLLGDAMLRIEYEERLFDQQLRWRLALDAARVGSLDWDLVSGEVTWDPPMFELTGFPTNETPTIDQFLAAIHPTDAGRVRTHLAAAMEAGIWYETEFRFRRPDGREIWLEVKGLAIADADGAVSRVVGVSSDVTARKRAEAIAAGRAIELRASAQHKDEFLAVLSHELRNPLAALASGIGLLRELPAAELDPIHEMLERQLAQLRRLLDDLLDTERIKRGKFSLERNPVDLSEVVQSAVEALRPSISRRQHDLSVSIEPALWVCGDAHRLAQVVGNVLDNACKHTPLPGHIRVEALREEMECVVRVEDDGAGIEASELEGIFDTFHQAETTLERGAGGLGLGLTLVRQIVELHGGTVTARSDGAGKGSTFEIRLLLQSPPHELHEPPVADARPIFSSCQRALVVDDNADLARLLAVRLGGLGLAVEVAHDGEQALRLAREKPPSVMLVDLGLPGVTGLDLVQVLRSEPATAATLFVAISGFMSDAMAAKAHEVGFAHHLRKPVELPDLLAALSSLRAQAGVADTESTRD